MAREVINVGAAPNDGQGDPIRTSFIKTNNNFGELYARAQENPPATLVGTVGDFAGMYAYDSTYFYYCFQDYDGSSIIWAKITNDALANLNQIINGTSSISIPTANANINVSVANVPNVVVFSSTGAIITGDLTVTGNANLSGNIVGDRITNGSSGVEIPAANGNVTVSVAGTANTTVFTADGPSVAGNVFGGNLIMPANSRLRGDFSTTAGLGRTLFQTTNTSADAPTFISAIPGDNNANSFVSAAFGAFSTADVANASVVGVYATSSSGSIRSVSLGTATLVPIAVEFNSTEVARWTAGGNLGLGNSAPVDRLSVQGNAYISGNVTSAGIFVGDGSGLTNVTATGNVGAASKLVSGTSELNIPVANGNIVGNVGGVTNLFEWSTEGFSAQGNITGGNIWTAGDVSATGNVTGAYILGDGSLLTGLPATYANADVATFLAAYGSNTFSSTGNVTSGNLRTTGLVTATGNVTGGNLQTTGQISATGNVTGAYILGDGSQLTGMYGNAEVVANLASLDSNPVSTTGNVTAAYFLGNGSLLTGITVTTTYGDANVTNLLANFGSNTISTSGNITVDNSARVTGQLYGLVNGVNTNYGVWDFGFIAANTYDNPIQWIFAQTGAGNIDMGTITAPASLAIDVGTIF